MQKRVWSLIVIILAIVVMLAACQSSTQIPVSNTEEVSSPTVPLELPKGQGETEVPTLQAETYPGPEQPYPDPELVLSIYNPYPGPSEGVSNYINWSEAEALVMRGDVLEAYQTQTLHVTLVLIEGNVALTIEPEIDEIFNVVERCGDLCKEIILATE